MTKQRYFVSTSDYDAYARIYYGVTVSSEKEYDNYEDAVAAAKKTARKTKEDVEIYSIHSVVKFPETDLEVEAMVQTT